jgi:O-methyltransferase involved in polyketide biosynthesis
MSRWDSISITAHYTARVWASNHFPCAATFDTPLGRLLHAVPRPLFRAAAGLGLTTPEEYLIQRHRIIDALVEKIAPAQLVELGSGLSARGLAYSQKWRAHCIDADLPRMMAAKAVLVDGNMPETYHQAALDLIECRDYAAEMATMLRRVSPTVVIAEGVLAYYEAAHQEQIFARVADLLRQCGGGTFLLDLHFADEVGHPAGLLDLFRRGLNLLAATRSPLLVGSWAEAEAMLQRAGFLPIVAHRPSDWAEMLDLPLRRVGAGLCVLEASIG